MATTVITAFDEFLKDKVNLDKELTKKARGSKDWLIDNIHKFPETDSSFPSLWNDFDIEFGSFARHTKIRPLDDIDLMIGISAQGSSSYFDISPTDIIVNGQASTLKELCDDNSNILNSIKVINKFKKNLENIPQYSKSDIKRNQEAAVLQLSSYDWNFDIVPCFFTSPDNIGRTYYLIPDGNGRWKKTDPRIDNERTTNINQRHEGRILNSIRILKYWNKRPTMPTAPSYMFENLIINYFDNNTNIASEYIDYNVAPLFYYIYQNIFSPVFDPKGLQGNLNILTLEEKQKISSRAANDYTKAFEAMKFEKDNNMKESINKWREIFGDEFPKYE